MQVVSTQQFVITKKPYVKGSHTTQWNVDLNGRPFAAIQTNRPQRGFTFTYQVHILNGASVTGLSSYDAAETWMRKQA